MSTNSKITVERSSFTTEMITTEGVFVTASNLYSELEGMADYRNYLPKKSDANNSIYFRLFMTQ